MNGGAESIRLQTQSAQPLDSTAVQNTWFHRFCDVSFLFLFCYSLKAQIRWCSVTDGILDPMKYSKHINIPHLPAAFPQVHWSYGSELCFKQDVGFAAYSELLNRCMSQEPVNTQGSGPAPECLVGIFRSFFHYDDTEGALNPCVNVSVVVSMLLF
jgi:hypothetical protein